MDKHVPGGTKGYKFFIENSLVVNENIYENGDKFGEECSKVYLDDEKNNSPFEFVYIFFSSSSSFICTR